MSDLSTPLNEEELSQLDEALLHRFDEDSEPLAGDEGIIDVTELDGLLTAVVSSPVMIMPSHWFPAVWGDCPPVFETGAEMGVWPGHDLPEFAETGNLQQSIAPNVRTLHAYWLERRVEPVPTEGGPYRRSTPRVGRNDPCPCGSGKKFKKCCLH